MTLDARPVLWSTAPVPTAAPEHGSAVLRVMSSKAPHHQGSYHTRARKIRNAANADPTTRCWRCQRTITDIRDEHPDAIWTAGHIIDGQVDGALAPECSPCNYSHGGRLGNERKRRTPLQW